MKTLIKNGTVVNASGSVRADVLVEGARIARVAPGIECEQAAVLDAAGCLVMPGFIDTHTHFDLDLGVTVTADDFKSGTKAALLGGTTCVLDFATQERDGSLQEALELWHKKAEGSSCNYGFHMALARYDESVRRELPAMTAQGVSSYKMYMVYNGLKVDDGQIYMALQDAAKEGALIGIHCENWEVLLSRIAALKAEGLLDPTGHPLSRPAAVEAEAVARLMRIAQLAQCPAYVVHLSSAEGLMEARRARERGQEVYLETCPQYLLLEDSCYARPDGAKFIMSPPIRKDADRAALWEALAKGEIQTVGTDHCSFTMAQKALGKDDFSKVPNGGAGVEHRGQLLYTYGVCEGRIGAEQMVAALSHNPARLFGMPEHGAIAEGMAADIVVWDTAYRGEISDTNHHYACDNSIYAGFAVRGRARDVLLNGLHAVRDGALVQSGTGRYIPRKAYSRIG